MPEKRPDPVGICDLDAVDGDEPAGWSDQLVSPREGGPHPRIQPDRAGRRDVHQLLHGFVGFVVADWYFESHGIAAEAAAINTWRDAVWEHCVALLGQVTAGTVPVPTEAELIAGLPVAPW